MATLFQTYRPSLVNASPKAIVDVSFLKIKNNVRRRTWLKPGNVYRKNCIGTIHEYVSTNIAVNDDDMSQYIAFSGPIHCIDGWSFFARAIASLWSGDMGSLVHFAYYAELRAAMSLMATQGVGIMNNYHYSVDSSGRCISIGSWNQGSRRIQGLGTHQFAWLVLQHWSTLRRSSDLTMKMIKPFNIELQQWMSSFGGVGIGSYSQAVGRRWFNMWGIDIKRMAKQEHNARNDASYRPQSTRIIPSMQERWDFINEVWGLCAPTPDSRFDLLDRQILRTTLHKLRSIPANQANAIFQNFNDSVELMTSACLAGISPAVLNLYNQSLQRSIVQHPCKIIEYAESKDAWGSKNYPFQILSRAFLLLRMATGACEILLKSSQIGRHNIRFWLHPMLKGRNVWPIDKMADFDDNNSTLCLLWDEVDNALANVEDWVTNNNQLINDGKTWKENLGSSMIVLAESERIGLWGLGI